MTKFNHGAHKGATHWARMVLLLGSALNAAQAASTDIANVPMATSNMVTPNVLVVYDNSQSMDAYMNGTLVSGSDASTRGNIGRQVMRNAITTYRNAFNWGLMSYDMTGEPSLYNTYAYYLGSDSGMVFTDDCVGYVAGVPPTVGISATNGNRRCIANPQPFSGGNYVTYDKTGDDADIQDVLYTTGVYATGLWGLTAGTGTNYNVYQTHNVGNSWLPSSFSSGLGTWSFTPTDAGYLSQNPPMTRQIYIPRGWGYNQSISGSGVLNQPVAVDGTTHYNSLISKLANETNGSTSEIKNGAVFTPLRGTLQSAKTYFTSSLAGNSTPVQYACQKNFVMLVTDGLPTGDTSGNLYSTADRTNSCVWNTSTNSCTSGTFGVAANDAISAVNALRTSTVSGVASTSADGTGAVTGAFDVQTYVVALGDTVANANSLSVMNSMAYNGGTSKALPASDATAFQNAITAISDDITAKVGSGAAVAVANAHVTSSDNASYASSYNSGTWTGDIDSKAINVTTGLTTTTSLWTAGTAGSQLDSRTSANRFIVTSPDTAGAIGGIQFQPATATITTAIATKLSTAQHALLNSPSSTDADTVLAYLRGDRSGETTGTYRSRVHLLGDMINGEPLLVRSPWLDYADTGYSSFKSSNASRARMLFQGANDGMLHAFDASTGAESWAFIPNMVIENLNKLSRKLGFSHQYYVDGTPVSGDVDFQNVDGATGSGSGWRTIIVGGLGKGGRGYYALDITSATAATEAAVKSKVLWEFPNSIANSTTRDTVKLNMGYSFGKPIIVKTKAKGWVVLLTSGYNNGTNAGDSGGDGLGHLYVVNPKTGDLIKDISTPSCSTTPTSTPCGLAQISAYVASSLNNTAEYVYGGDLQGGLWRFDFTGNSVSSWVVDKFAALKDASGAAQPVTTAPELAELSINGVGTRMVYVGTGLYLGTSDIPGSTGANAWSSQVQTMYGLKDSLAALPTPLRSNLQQQTVTTVGTKRTSSNNAVNYTTKKGWYLDLPTTGERSNTDPTIALGALIFTTNIPSATVCQPGGSSWEYFLDLKTGGLAGNSSVSWSGTFLGNVLASRPVLIQLPSGKVVSLVRTSDAETLKEDIPIAAPGIGAKRISWRELFN